MPDREKVIEGLGRCIEKLDTVVNITHGFNCTACPYFRKCDRSGYLIGLPLMHEALALLKAQEPVKPTIDIRHGKSMWRCGSCSTALQPNQMHAKFCFNCGKAVKWDA